MKKELKDVTLKKLQKYEFYIEDISINKDKKIVYKNLYAGFDASWPALNDMSRMDWLLFEGKNEINHNMFSCDFCFFNYYGTDTLVNYSNYDALCKFDQMKKIFDKIKKHFNCNICDILYCEEEGEDDNIEIIHKKIETNEEYARYFLTMYFFSIEIYSKWGFMFRFWEC